MSDSGLYECQVSYHDDVEKKLKMPVRLIVLGKGPSLYYVSKGAGWVGSEKWQFLLMFSTIYANVSRVGG